MKFVAIRLIQLIVVLLVATFFTYSLTFVANSPAEVVDKTLGQNAGDQRLRDNVTDEFNLDDPFVVRYGKWMGSAVSGDLGYSYSGRAEVTSRLAKGLPRTLSLVFWAQVLAIGLAIPAGVIAAFRANTWVDRGLSGTSILMLAIPNYVLAILLVYFFAVQWDIFDAVSSGSPGFFSLKELFLPALALAAGQVAVYMRLLRTDMIATLQEDFIDMARSKGLSSRAILLRHALRPSSLSLVTTIGINTGAAIGGTVIIEVIFGINGMGSMLVTSIFQTDLFMTQGIVAVVAVGFVLINFIIDLLYATLDPRISRG